MTGLTWAIVAGGVLHTAMLCAGLLVPRVLDWRGELATLSPMVRQLVWVHGAFIVLTVAGLGAVSVLCAGELASGGTLARAVCGFIAVFWGLRLAMQLFYFAPGVTLSNLALKAGYHGLTLVIAYLTAVFSYAALRPA